MKYSEYNKLIIFKMIEAHLEQHECIAPRSLMASFGVSRAQASKLIREYKALTTRQISHGNDTEMDNLYLIDEEKTYYKSKLYQRMFLADEEATHILSAVALLYSKRTAGQEQAQV